MRRITFLCALLLACCWQMQSQVLNEPANWPNPSWVITGSFNVDPLAFEADPTTSSNFAFDDDDAGGSHEDNIAAESPVIDLTPAFTAGETWLRITVDYVYRYLANDVFEFQYYDADAATWVTWEPIPGNNTLNNDNYCSLPKLEYVTNEFDISGFTPTQLSGFKYRIFYDDDPDGTDWNYGFCLDAPVLTSETPPTCLDPSDLTAINSTTIGADLGWTDNTGASLWDIEVVEAGTTPTGTADYIGVATNPYTVTDLNASTSYEFYVRADCGGGDVSNWIGPMGFMTDCAVVVSLPYTENFDSYGTGSAAFPNCWERPVTYDSGTTWPSIVSHGSSISLKFQSAVGTPTYAVSPAFAEDINNLRVSFILEREGTSSGTIDIGVMSDPLDPSTFELVQTIDPSNTTDFVEYTFNLNLTTLTGGNNHIALRHNSDSAYWYYWLDDFVVELLPSCLEPSDLTLDAISSISADISWTAGDDETAWDVIYGEPGFDPETAGTTVNVTTDPNTALSGLLPDTNYDVYVRANCGAGDLSALVGPISFKTDNTTIDFITLDYNQDVIGEGNGPIENFTTVDFDGEGYYLISETYQSPSETGPADFALPSNGLLENQLADGPNYYQLKDYTGNNAFQLRANTDVGSLQFDNPSAIVELYMMVTSAGAASTISGTIDFQDGTNQTISDIDVPDWFNSTDLPIAYQGFGRLSPDGDYQPNATNPRFYQVSISIDPANANKMVTGISLNRTDTDDGVFSLLAVEGMPTPSCVAPTNLTSAGLTATSVDLTWDVAPSQTEWTVIYGPVGFDPETEGTTVSVNGTPSTTLTLTSNTSYDIYVKAICGVGDESSWTGPITIQTLCVSGTVPFFEGFESGNTDGETLGGCWSQNSISGTTSWTANSSETDYNRTPRTGSFNVYLRYGNTDWMFYPVQLTGGTTYELIFYARQDGTSGVSIEAAFGTSDDDAAMTNTIVASSAVVDGDYQEFSGYFSPATTDTYYIGIKGTLNFSPWYLSVDDLSVEEATGCLSPTDLTTANATSEGADLGWTDLGGASMWDIEVVPTGTAPTGSPDYVGVTSNPYTATGLDSGTTFDFYVRGDCGTDGVSDWSDPMSFTTLYSCGDVFYDSGGAGGNYSADENTVSTFVPDTPGEMITITFTMVDIESAGTGGTDGCYDYLTIYDGPDTSYPLLAGTQCGEESGDGGVPGFDTSLLSVGDSFTSTDPSGALTVVFTSDGSVMEGGWEADVTCAPPPPTFAYAINNATQELVSFDVTDPLVLTVVGTSPVTVNFENAGAIDPANPGTAYVMDDQGEFYSVDIASGVYTLLGTIAPPGTETWTGMAFDPITGTLYAVSSDGITSTLSSIDVVGVSATNIGVTGMALAISVGIDANGDLYGHDIGDDNLYLIDKTTGVGTIVGYTGFDANYGQGMAWDYNTNTMYMAAYNFGTNQPEWRSVNTFSGNTTLIGALGDGSGQFAWVSTPGAMITSPTCPSPVLGNVTGIAQSIATLGWTENGTATSWDIEYGPIGFDPTGTPTDVGVANPYPLSGLMPATTYEFYVRADCGGGDASAWSGPFQFTTECGVVDTFPYTETFEDTSGTRPCWSNEYVVDAFDWAYVAQNGNATISARTGSLMAEFRNTTMGSSTKLVSPAIDLTSLTNPQLQFYFANVNWVGDIDELRVYYKTSATGAWTQIGTDYTAEHTEWTQIVLNLPNASADYYIAFEATSNWARGMDIDDVWIGEAPSCPQPANLAIDFTSDTQVDFSWDTEPNASLGYEWFIFTAGADPTTDTPIDSGTTAVGVTNASSSLLTASTMYDIYVQSNCDADGMSELAGPLSFETLPTPPANDNLFNAIPLTMDAACSGDIYTNVGATLEANEPSGSCGFLGDPAQTTVWFSFVAPAGGSVIISTDYLPGVLDDSQIAVFAAPTDLNDLSTLPAETGCDEDGGEVITLMSVLELTGLTDGATYYIQVDGYGGGEGTFCITVMNNNPCPSPTNIVIDNVDDATATVTWVPGGSETEWEVEYGPTGFDLGTGTIVPVTPNPTTILSVLDPETSYDVYVTANCGAETSTAVGPETFTTTAVPDSSCEQTQISNNFENGLFMEEGGQLIANDFIVSSSTVNFAVESITANLMTMGGIASVDVLFLQDNAGLPGAQIGTTIEDVVPTSQTIIGTAFGYDVQEVVLDLPAPVNFAGTGTTDDAIYWVQLIAVPTVPGTQVAWEVTTLDLIGNPTAFDNLTGTWNPSADGSDGVFTISGICTYVDCPAPINLMATPTSSTSVDITWTEIGSATEWEVEYGAPGFALGTGTVVSDNDGDLGVTLSTLTAGTEYEYYVTSICGVGQESYVTGPASFMTPVCDPSSQCDYTFTLTDVWGDGWNGAVMEVRQNGVAVATLELLTGLTMDVNVPICDGVDFELYWSVPGDYDEEVGVVITNPFGVPIYTLVPATETAPISLFTSTGSCTPPSCEQPLNLQVTNIDPYSATLSWDIVTGATNGYVWYVFADGADPTTDTPVDTGTVGAGVVTAEADGLTPVTAYDFYVEADCDANGMSDLSGPISFETTPIPPANDNLFDAIPLTINAECSGDIYTNVGATAETNEPAGDCWFGADGVQTSVWFSFVAPTGGSVVISTDYLPGVLNDAQIAVYGEPTDLNDLSTLPIAVICDEDSGVDIPLMNIIELNGLTDGETYYIQLDGYNGAEGTFCITVTNNACPEPTNISATDIGEDSAQISWTPGGGETEWEVEYGEAGFAPGTGAGTIINVTATPTTLLSSLNLETAYDVYVTAICDAETSLQVGPYTFSTLGTNGCAFSNPSNAFENGSSNSGAIARIVANDIIVPADQNFSLENIVFTEFMNPGITAATVDVFIYIDNGGVPGTLLTTIPGVVPTSQSVIGDNFGYDASQISLDITPYDLNGQAGADTTYWIGLSVYTSDGSNCFWENTTASIVGIGQAYDDGTGIGYVIDPTLDGVYSFNGTCSNLGVESQVFEDFTFYPNPVKHSLFLKATSEIQQVEVFNLLGQSVLKTQPNSLEPNLDLSGLQAGAYLMKVTINGQEGIYRLIKE